MHAVEDAIRDEGGRLVMIETASKPSYDESKPSIWDRYRKKSS